MMNSAVIVGPYRYRLTREFGGTTTVVFVMLNPSVANAQQDDPTLRRCCGFARAWGFGRLEVVNLYAYRATHPGDMWAAHDAGVDIVGPSNDHQIGDAIHGADTVVAAWGAYTRPGRPEAVRAIAARMGHKLYHLGLTANGSPRHPLYAPRAVSGTPAEVRILLPSLL